MKRDILLVPVIPVNDYILVVLAAESSTCTFAGNCGHGGQWDACRADVSALTAVSAVTRDRARAAFRGTDD